MKPVYFLSDAHLGSLAIPHRRMQERRLVNFLDSIKEKASAVYLLGDIFDFWHEYRYVVPKGYTRLLGKLSELTDSGVEVHFFTGNHDLWVKDYFERECGMIVHRGISLTTELYGKVFYLAHGDGLGTSDRKYLWLRRMFHNPLCQRLFASIHPRWGMWFGMRWAEYSRRKHEAQGGEPPYAGEDKEELVLFAKDYLSTHHDVNYFIFGHRHIELDLMLEEESRMLIIGDWIDKYTYAVFDGENLFLENFIEGETQP
ncbi:MAG: UDP-2,3-diacylglucosamine diphosphatase [Alloprevotella sp.]|nr:UDP-2,3-diacylglucosamine diphosphatase [Alloprevotella sp.]MBR6375256.1 UDP-2,3-diacylglucosamine diphosphatase [Alloprevotella sp.]